jgi:hypothetical protein
MEQTPDLPAGLNPQELRSILYAMMELRPWDREQFLRALAAELEQHPTRPLPPEVVSDAVLRLGRQFSASFELPGLYSVRNRPPRRILSAMEEERIIARLEGLVDKFAGMITTEACRNHLQQGLYELLHAGTLAVAQVREWAEGGNPAADLALRRYAAEQIDQGRETVQLKDFAIKRLLDPFILNYSKGHTLADTWVRDIVIRVIMDVVSDETGLPPTRGRVTKAPSVGSFVHLLAQKRSWRLREQQINRIYHGYKHLAACLDAAMPVLSAKNQDGAFQ